MNFKIGDKCRLSNGWNKANKPNDLICGNIQSISGRFATIVTNDGKTIIAAISGLIHPTEDKFLI